MLQTLEAKTESDVRGLLTKAALSLQPQPTPIVVDAEVAALIADARQQLRIKPTDQSHASRAKVQSLLGELLSARLLPESERQAVRNRMGVKGVLPTSQYDIMRNPALLQRGNICRAKWSHILDAIQNADVVEHFRIVEGLGDAPMASLFMRRPPGHHDFWWLIHCQRVGAQLLPLHAWRLFDDTFSREEIETPRDAIISLANKFGVDLSVNGKTMKIAFREAVPNPVPGESVLLVDSPALKFQGSSTGEAEFIVGLSYQILDLAYTQYLDRHGITENW
jgi:hypothetical protein